MGKIIEIIKFIAAFVKTNSTIVLTVVIAALCFLLSTQCNRISELKNENSILVNNQKAYENENSKLKEKAYEFEMTIDAVNASKDSITQELVSTKKELGIKDKNLQSMAYMLSHATKTDTISFNDTIFIDPGFYMDTTISDEWYSTKLVLEYPGDVIVSSNFISKKEVFVSYKKETVNAPKKFFLFRWFQKKHYVTTIDVVDKNPYIINDSERFIKIIE